MKKNLILLFLFVTFVVFSEVVDVKTIPNPRNSGGWITQIGSYLSNSEIEKVNQILDTIEKETTIEVAVVVLPNTGGDVFTFTQELFDYWKIGKKDKNNGVLIVASMEEREFRTHTGYGVEAILPDGLIRKLQDRVVVPRFREGRYGAGIINYLESLNSIFNKSPDVAKYLDDYSDKDNTTSLTNKEGVKFRPWKLLFVIIGSFLFLVSGFSSIFKLNKRYEEDAKKKFTRYSDIKKLHENGFGESGSGGMFLFIVTIFVNLFFNFYALFFINLIAFFLSAVGVVSFIVLTTKRVKLQKKVVKDWRNNPRSCPECDKPMNKLSETEDDNYLSKSQRTEEELKSYDYDVWLCSSCGNKTIEQFRDRNYLFYITCVSCGGLTAKQTGSKVVSYPTYTSSGERKLIFKCKSCNHEFYKYVVIPRLERTTSSSYSGGSSGGYSGGSSYSGGGGSFGGGSSGGGGASSKW